MLWQWFGGSVVDFFTPITSPGTAWWRKSHIWAHVYGGVAIAALLHCVTLGYVWHGQFHTLLVFGQHPLAILGGTGVVQATFWELRQREMWDAVCEILRKPANTTYPWLSGLWDTLFAMGGAAALLLLLTLIRSLV